MLEGEHVQQRRVLGEPSENIAHFVDLDGACCLDLEMCAQPIERRLAGDEGSMEVTHEVCEAG